MRTIYRARVLAERSGRRLWRANLPIPNPIRFVRPNGSCPRLVATPLAILPSPNVAPDRLS
jgi:hypothetical protein